MYGPRSTSIDASVLNPLTPVPAVTSLGLSSTSDAITFDRNWHHLYSACAGGKDLSSDTQRRVIDVMEPEICTKMLKKLNEKLGKISYPNTRLLHGKNCPSRSHFLSKPSRRSIAAAKRKEKEKKDRPKKN